MTHWVLFASVMPKDWPISGRAGSMESMEIAFIAMIEAMKRTNALKVRPGWLDASLASEKFRGFIKTGPASVREKPARPGGAANGSVRVREVVFVRLLRHPGPTKEGDRPAEI